nr:reverse transcriptase domain-containing protein [Tanacetum cinerariifolium]
MVDTHTMLELLQAPTEGYGDAIVIPAILVVDSEIKFGLLQLVTSSQFYGFERDDPHAHIRWFNKSTSMLKYKNVPHDTTNLKNDITNFQQKFDVPFSEARDRCKDLLRKCPHHGFSKLHQIDTFYNALTQSDQDSLNAVASGNLLNRTPREALTIIENKSKVRISRNKPGVLKVSTTTSYESPSLDVTALTEIVKELLLNIKATQQATMKSIEETCVICGGPHPYYECLAAGGNTFDACAAVGTYNQGGSLPSNTVANPRGDLKAITTQRDVAYEGPSIPPPTSIPKEVEREPEVTKDKKLSLLDLTPTRMTLELATRSIAYPAGIAEDVFVQVGKFTFPANFVVVDYDVDPRVPLIFGRPILRTARALVDVRREELILRDGDEQLIFPADRTLKHPHKHGTESKIECLLNRDPLTEFDIEIIDPILKKFTDEHALDYSPPLGDDDVDLFDLMFDNDEWKKLLYGDCYKDIDPEKDKNKDSKMKLLVNEANIVEPNDLLTQLLDNDSTLPEESSELSKIDSLSSSPFRNKEKVFNPGILILGGTQIFNDESKDKDLILEERNFLSISSD